MLDFLVGTGARFGEAAGLLVRHLHLDAERPYVDIRLVLKWARKRWKLGRPKTRSSVRRITLSPKLVEFLRPLVEGKHGDEHVFSMVEGGPLHHGNFYNRYFRPAVKAAGRRVPGRLRIHDLRHTHAAWLLSDGVPTYVVQRRLGHSDHPIAEVRQARHRWATRGSEDINSPTSAYIERLRATYTDPSLSWGDAAVPDDTVWVCDAVALLTEDTTTRRHGLPILDVALPLGKTEAEIRELVKPQRRSGGFTRPAYLAYANQSKTYIKAIPCPHGRCRGRRHADHVSLLPEVAASGYGVRHAASSCRRRRVPSRHD